MKIFDEENYSFWSLSLDKKKLNEEMRKERSTLTAKIMFPVILHLRSSLKRPKTPFLPYNFYLTLSTNELYTLTSTGSSIKRLNWYRRLQALLSSHLMDAAQLVEVIYFARGAFRISICNKFVTKWKVNYSEVSTRRLRDRFTNKYSLNILY